MIRPIFWRKKYHGLNRVCMRPRKKEIGSRLYSGQQSKLRIFGRERAFWPSFYFNPSQSYSTYYSLDHFIEGRVRGKDSVTLETALTGIEAVLEFVFGDAFNALCE